MELPVAPRWWKVEPAAVGVTLLWEPHLDPFVRSNVWHVRGRDLDLVVDAGNGVGRLRPTVARLAGDRPVIAIATHEHFDHIGGLREFDERLAHPADAAGIERPYAMALLREDFPPGFEEEVRAYGYAVPQCIATALPAEGFDLEGWRTPGAVPTRLVEDGETVDLGDRTFSVVHLPGHTPGSIGLLEEASGFLFAGDAVYVDDALMAEDEAAFCRSLERLLDLPVRSVFGGHGPVFGRDRLLGVIGAELAARGRSGSRRDP